MRQCTRWHIVFMAQVIFDPPSSPSNPKLRKSGANTPSKSRRRNARMIPGQSPRIRTATDYSSLDLEAGVTLEQLLSGVETTFEIAYASGTPNTGSTRAAAKLMVRTDIRCAFQFYLNMYALPSSWLMSSRGPNRRPHLQHQRF